MFILKLISCLISTTIIGGVVNAVTSVLETCPIIEEKERPFYIVRTYKEIKDGYKN